MIDLSNLLLDAASSTFVWREHIFELVINGLLSMVPTYEGRYAVVSCIAMGVPTVFAYFYVLVLSSIPIPLIMLLLRPVLNWLYKLPIKPLRKFAAWVERRSERKHKEMDKPKEEGSWFRRHFSGDALEMISLYLFVSVPLPGTGIWTGTIIATLFDMPRLKSGITIFLGNVTACLITTLATTGVLTIFG